MALFSVWSPGLPGRPSWSATSRIELSTLFLPCDSAEIVGIVILAHDSRRFAKDGAWFRVAGRYGFRLAGDSATNVPSRTGPQGRFFIARNPVSSRDFARFCRCHARRVLRPKPARFASLFLSLLNLPSPTGANWHRQNSCRGTKLRSCRRERSESMIGAAIGVREPRGGDHPAAHGMRYKPSFWLVTTSAS